MDWKIAALILMIWWIPAVLLIRARRYAGWRQFRWLILLLLGGWFAFVFLSLQAPYVRANPDQSDDH